MLIGINTANSNQEIIELYLQWYRNGCVYSNLVSNFKNYLKGVLVN
jgi:hypothetical protein